MQAKIKMETVGNTGEGNTKPPPRVVPSKYWCFTFNNYNQKDLETLETTFKSFDINYYFGEEVGKQGTPHLQGFIQSKSKIRPIEKLKLNEGIHWEPSRGSVEQNIKYCSKDGKIHTNMKFKAVVKDPMDGLELYEWQKKLLELIIKPPTYRKITWIYESKGNAGKSVFSKHLVMKYDALCVIGKAADVKHGFVELNKVQDIPIVIWDIPRCIDVDYISYTAIEEILNGCLYSTKYESGMCIFNPPHIIVFSNQEPDRSKCSNDRWEIWKI